MLSLKKDVQSVILEVTDLFLFCFFNVVTHRAYSGLQLSTKSGAFCIGSGCFSILGKARF